MNSSSSLQCSILILALASGCQPKSAEPRIGGRPAGEIIRQAAETEPTRRAAAAELLRQSPEVFLPLLLDLVASEFGGTNRTITTAATPEPGIPSLPSLDDVPPTARRAFAAHGFAALGPLARPALPRLSALAQRPGTAGIAAMSLLRIGPEGVDALLPALLVENLRVRQTVAAAFSVLSRSAANLQPPLLAAVTHADELTRGTAAIALGRIGGDIPATMAVLPRLLEDSSETVRVNAATALANLGKESAPAFAQLLALHHKGSKSEQNSTALALWAISPDRARDAGVKPVHALVPSDK